MQLCFGTADRHAEFGGDLLVFPAFDVMQHQHGAGTLGQRRDGALQVELVAHPLAGGVLGGDVLERAVVGLAILAIGAAAQVHQRGVHRQPVQPGRERALEAERRQRLPGADETFLHQVLCPRRLATRQAPDHGIDAPRMPAKQRFEGAAIAPSGRTRQRMVAVGLNGHLGAGQVCGHGDSEHIHSDAGSGRRV